MKAEITPPIAEKIPHKITAHGSERTDYYHWLRDDNWQKFIKGDLDFHNPKVADYIEAENKYTESMMADSSELQEVIYQELLSRLKEDDEQAPMKHGDYFYYSRIEKGKNYHYCCRKKGNLDAPEEIYFDINVAAEGKGYYSLGALNRSRGDRYLAYSENTTGSMDYSLKVRDLETGEDFPWEAKGTTGSHVDFPSWGFSLADHSNQGGSNVPMFKGNEISSFFTSASGRKDGVLAANFGEYVLFQRVRRETLLLSIFALFSL